MKDLIKKIKELNDHKKKTLFDELFNDIDFKNFFIENWEEWLLDEIEHAILESEDDLSSSDLIDLLGENKLSKNDIFNLLRLLDDNKVITFLDPQNLMEEEFAEKLIRIFRKRYR